MSEDALTLRADLMDRGSRVVAVVQTPAATIDIPSLERVIATLDQRITTLLLVTQDVAAPDLEALARCAPPAATAQPVTDALKRTETGRLVSTVDRSQIVRLGLPMVLDLARLRARLAGFTETSAPVWQLIGDPAATTLLDERGEPLG